MNHMSSNICALFVTTTYLEIYFFNVVDQAHGAVVRSMALSIHIYIGKLVPGSAQRKRCCLVGTNMTIKRSPAPEKLLGECPNKITFLAWRLDDKTQDCWDNGEDVSARGCTAGNSVD